MDEAVDEVWASIGPYISVRVAAPPMADVVFLPTDDAGTPGELNSAVLKQLNLTRDLPRPVDLRKGYHIERWASGLLCYVVTVTNIPPHDALRANLSAALTDPLLASARSIWLPLMGTGAGRIAHIDSFSITVETLRLSKLMSAGDVTAIVSVPRRLRPEERQTLYEAVRKASGEAEAEAAQTEAIPSGDPLTLPRSDAVTGALEYASRLAELSRDWKSMLTTEVLFFALAECQAASSPTSLRDDIAAECFSDAVLFLASDRYPAARQAYFGTGEPPSSRAPKSAPLGRPTQNVAAVMHRAHLLAGGGGMPIQVDNLVTALLKLKEARLQQVLGQMGVASDRLLTEYRDARLGRVITKFANDVPTIEDQLGYAGYATAIYEFLTHAETPPPLSVSIQAPWGVGKSSLMNLVREKLDPQELRDKFKQSGAGPRDSPRLLLGSVVRFLDRKEDFAINVDPAYRADGPDSPKRLWTVWFNAWQYDTTEQVWAGLVDAIVSQIADRLSPLEREKFLLKLQLARVDDGKIRKQIYDRVVTIWWAKVRAWALAGLTLAMGLFGVCAVKPTLPDGVQKAVSLLTGQGYSGAVAAQIILSLYLVGSYFKSRSETRNEPATFSLAEYIRVPDYEMAVGAIHQIHADLRRVLAVVPKPPGESDHAPLVIFIDDLDRCSPGKVACVVEGVSMLLASDTYRCMFVIGMDPQMVAAALEKAHEDVRQRLPRFERAVPLGWRFMDKFIQLPFTIPPTGRKQFTEYVEWLVGDTSHAKDNSPQGGSGAGQGAPLEEVSSAMGGNERGDKLRTNSSRNDPPDVVPVQEVAASFADSRDVGSLIRNISAYSVGNPREMKRMVNVARFYLALRSVRRRRDDGWRAPELDQYARWIALTLRWPDMMRWLQWGADEAHWPPEQMGKELVVRRLRTLEAHAQKADVSDAWQKALKDELNIPVDADSDWARDSKLFDFFKRESEIEEGKRLSDAAERCFW